MYTLHIANKNYSSWSLRPWLLCHVNRLPFQEVMHPLQQKKNDQPPLFGAFSPSGKVPCLEHEGLLIWDSLAITEYLAERHSGIWPEKTDIRAWARSVVAEIHSGFQALRGLHSMNIGVRVQVDRRPVALIQDIQRVEQIWAEALARFGGPYLLGDRFLAVDAFFAPFVFRFQTYGVPLSTAAVGYRDFLLSHPSMQLWQKDAINEILYEPDHDAESEKIGKIVDDMRTRN